MSQYNALTEIGKIMMLNKFKDINRLLGMYRKKKITSTHSVCKQKADKSEIVFVTIQWHRSRS